ncbi:MAG: lytic transglycosylase domain-containing protein [Caulobacteraceae bacterium]
MADPRPLYDPATNLRVGQDYLDFLLTRASHGDLLRAIAAYNGGPGTLMRTQAIVGDGDPPDADRVHAGRRDPRLRREGHGQLLDLPPRLRRTRRHPRRRRPRRPDHRRQAGSVGPSLLP